MKRLYALKGSIQHYEWGGTELIPHLLGLEICDKPFAELWIGAHPNKPSVLSENGEKLDVFIQKNPTEVLGKEMYEAFGQLSYLLKVLDVNKMLSIQVHPNKEQAELGFQKENYAAVALNDANDANDAKRNYKDSNHKPEFMIALSDFWLLHGFKPLQTIKQTLKAVPALSDLVKYCDTHQQIYTHIMSIGAEELKRRIQSLRAYLFTKNELSKDDILFWVKRALEAEDHGLLSMFLFNLVHLKYGEGIYQDAGIPHSYLYGQNVEIMANSDNVLRGGLTSKHIDIKELLTLVRYEKTIPHIFKTEGEVNSYESLHPDFALMQFNWLREGTYHAQTKGLELGIVLKGSISISTSGKKLVEKLVIGKGECFAILADTEYSIHSLSKSTQEATQVFKAAMA